MITCRRVRDRSAAPHEPGRQRIDRALHQRDDDEPVRCRAPAARTSPAPVSASRTPPQPRSTKKCAGSPVRWRRSDEPARSQPGASVCGAAVAGAVRATRDPRISRRSDARSSTSYQTGRARTGKPDLGGALDGLREHRFGAPGDLLEQAAVRPFEPDQVIAAILGRAENDPVARAWRAPGRHRRARQSAGSDCRN